MIVNLNVRVLTNGAIFTQYQENGKAKDAAFSSWQEFLDWLVTVVPASKTVTSPTVLQVQTP